MRKMKKLYVSVISAVIALVMITAFTAMNAYAGQVSKSNASSGYKAVIEDDADKLNDAQEQKLLDRMYPITEYGNVAFKTINTNSRSSARAYAENYYYTTFGNASGTVFLIDFDTRQIYIASDGEMYKTITSGIANTITDNVYTYASDGDYFGCAMEAFDEILLKMQGKSIAEPMKHINNVLIALIAALIINFIIVSRKARLRRARVSEIVESAKYCTFNSTQPHAAFLKTTKKYDPVQKSGGGGGGFGGGGGGGGFGGGGGGHGF